MTKGREEGKERNLCEGTRRHDGEMMGRRRKEYEEGKGGRKGREYIKIEMALYSQPIFID